MCKYNLNLFFFFFQAEDGIRDIGVTGVQTCALPIFGEGETCSGDPARRIGNEFVFQMLAQQNVETLNEAFGDRPVKKIVATCPHCFNTLGNEYEQLGRSEEHTSELQSRQYLVCRLLLEK